MFWSGICENIKLKSTIPNHENPEKTKQWYPFYAALVAFTVSQLHILEQRRKIDKSSRRVILLLITHVGYSINGDRKMRNTEKHV